jgi:hypothetical protein
MIDKPEPRRFPPPWIAEETDACFIVRDASGQALAYVYFEDEPGRRAAAKFIRDTNGQALAYAYFEDEPGRRAAAHLPTRDEARRIAVNIAKLPELRRGPPPTKRGVTRLEPHISRQSAQCRLRPQVRKYRRNALSDVMGQFET